MSNVQLTLHVGFAKYRHRHFGMTLVISLVFNLVPACNLRTGANQCKTWIWHPQNRGYIHILRAAPFPLAPIPTLSLCLGPVGGCPVMGGSLAKGRGHSDQFHCAALARFNECDN